MITERNMVFANPQAYRVFPQIGNPYNTGITDTAIYEGYLQVTDDSGTTKSFTNTSTIDFTGFKGIIDIDQYTDTGSVKLGRWRITDTMENDIMSSMVLWYDLAKQGATNESMAADPRLIDHSGNGHHATCYNFAWGGMSAIGGYVMSMSNFALNGALANITLSKTKTSIHIELTDEFAGDYVIGCSPTDWDLTKDRTFCINSTYSQGFKLSYYNSNVGVPAVDIPANGDVFVPANPDSDCKVLYFNLNSIRGAGTIDIELLPAYPDALVSDGVDDFAQVLDLPLLNIEQGYTIIAKRTYLNDAKGCLASYRRANATSGPFALELVELNRTDSFGVTTHLKTSIPELITWQRKDSYNGTSISYKGTPFDDKVRCLTIFKLNPDSTFFNFIGQIALNSLILFNRDLTNEEIEWVKTNLITE